MQAISTKYCGPTNTRGGRIRASAQAGYIYVPWDHSLGIDENHARAAQEYCKRKGWVGPYYSPLVSGGLADGSSVHVFSESEPLRAALHVLVLAALKVDDAEWAHACERAGVERPVDAAIAARDMQDGKEPEPYQYDALCLARQTYRKTEGR